ncbi:MAG: hypothetical protein IPM83_16645 [Ignavibacteria bacterium]|nr:hypothetical protein [Ignavibacteria bacterium]
MDTIIRSDDRGTAMAFATLALCTMQQRLCRALSYYYRALSIYELNGDTFGLAAVYGNIENIHSSAGNSTEHVRTSIDLWNYIQQTVHEMDKPM